MRQGSSDMSGGQSRGSEGDAGQEHRGEENAAAAAIVVPERAEVGEPITARLLLLHRARVCCEPPVVHGCRRRKACRLKAYVSTLTWVFINHRLDGLAPLKPAYSANEGR